MFYQRETPNEPMYSNIQRFYIKSGLGEERPRELRIIIDQTSVYGRPKQVLQIQVLDDDDPFFYYSLLISEDDYLRLKNNQGLLVDFNSFPAQLVRLLEQCKEHESVSSKFMLLFEEEGRADCAKTFLKIVETNNFKHLCHLVLQIEHGNDEDIKKIMVKKIKTLKEQNCKAENTIMSLESQLNSRTLMLEAAEMKVVEVENKWKNNQMTFQAESARGLHEETEKMRKAHLDWQIKAQREKAEVEEKFHSTMREKDNELSKLRLEISILSEKRAHAEAALSEQAKRVDVMERELVAVRSDLAATRKTAAKLENELRDKDRTLSSLKSKVAAAEQESKDKVLLMSRQEELLKSAQEQKARLEGTLQEKEAYIAKKQKTIHSVSEELIKANDIIAKLQKELNASASKLKTRTDIALEQEKVIEKHEKSIERLERELKIKTKKLENLDMSEEGLKTTINELQETLETKEKKIKENEKIIDWLNRRCTEQAVQSYTPSYSALGQNPGIPGGSVAVTTNMPNPSALGTDFKTSTPFERFKESRVPFTTMSTPPSRFNILALDKMETPAILEEESENEDPSPPAKTAPKTSSPKELAPHLDDKKKASAVDPPKIATKPARKFGPPKKNGQPSAPSSYFLS